MFFGAIGGWGELAGGLIEPVVDDYRLAGVVGVLLLRDAVVGGEPDGAAFTG